MGSFRTRMRCLRWVLAWLLAVAGVVHMPSVVMGWSGSAHQEHSVARSQHVALQSSHQHHAHVIAIDVFDGVDDAYGVLSCQAVGCCLALNLPAWAAPPAFDQLLGRFDAAPAEVMVPAPPDPADPPPRRQA